MNQYLELDSEGLAEFLPPSSSQMPKKPFCLFWLRNVAILWHGVSCVTI
jgi:hypothetical protein